MATRESGASDSAPKSQLRLLKTLLLIVMILGGYQVLGQLREAEAERIAKLDADDRKNPYTLDQVGCTQFDADDDPDIDALFEAGRVAEIGARVGFLQAATEQDIRCDRFLDYTLGLFGDAVETREKSRHKVMANLDRWIESEPDSYIPWLLRGTASVELAYQARGTKLSRDTSEAQFSAMKAEFAKARSDLERTLAINPRAVGAYFGLLRAARADSPNSESVRLLDEALAVQLPSLRLFNLYMSAIDPRWGGGFDWIQKGIDRARPYFSENPSLRLVLGHPHHVRALRAYRDERYTESVQGWTKALQYGRKHEWHTGLADSLRKTRNFQSSIKEYDKAIEIWAESSSTWRLRGRANMAIRRHDEAIKDFTQAIKYNDGSRRPYQDRGWAYDTSGRYEEAIVDLYHAKAMFKKPSSWTLNRLGSILYHDLKRYEEAEAIYVELLDLYPTEESAWFRYGMTLHGLNKPGANDALEHYLSIVDLSDSGQKSNVDEARRALGTDDGSEEIPNRRLPGLALVTS